MITVKLKLSLLLLCCRVIQGECLEVERLGSSSDLDNITKLSKAVKVVQTFPQLLGAALEREPWSAAEQPCVRSLRRALADADNFTLYAVWMLDAMQLPNGQLFGSAAHLGNYDECLEPRWRRSHPDLNTQYCFADVQLLASPRRDYYLPDPEHSAETYLKTLTYNGLDLGFMYWGLCLPARCPKSAVTKMYRILLRVSHLGPIADDAVINVNYCQVAGQDKGTYDGVKMVGVVMASLLAVAVGSTYYVTNYKLNPKSYAHEILRSFCLKRNYASLTSVSEDELYSMNVIRLLSSVYVVWGHYLIVFYPKLQNNGLNNLLFKDFDENDHPKKLDFTLIVDIFLAYSGLLIVRGFLGSKLVSPLKFMLKRYVRYVSLIIVAIFVKMVALSELADGPMWAPSMDVERDICRRYWWLTLAMLQNHAGIDKHCLMWVWSTAVDYHLSVLGVVLCVIYRKNARLGIYIFSLVCLVLLPIPGYMQYKDSLPVMLSHGLESIRDMRKNRNMPLFISPHARAGPFLIGMMLGWILVKHKPAHYRNRISQIPSYILLVLCLAVMKAMALLGGTYGNDSTAMSRAVFTSLFRTVFAAAVCGVTALAEYGDLGILNSFIKWSPWVPLSRLCYGVYILHFFIAERNVLISRNSYHVDGFTTICGGLGVATVTFFFSFVLYLLVEAPSVNVVGLLLNGPRGSKQDSTKLNVTPTEAETNSRTFEDKKIQ